MIGAVVTGILLGSAALTLAVGLWFGATSRRKVLLLATLLMIATGAGFLAATSFWPLLVVGAVGTLNHRAAATSACFCRRNKPF